MKVYVATKIDNKEAGVMFAYKLARMGVDVTSRWLEVEKKTRPEERHGPQWELFAQEWGHNDMHDVDRADRVVFLSVPEGMKGTWVEFGLALGLNKQIHWVGDRNQTVFTWLDQALRGAPICYHDTAEDVLSCIAYDLSIERAGEFLARSEMKAVRKRALRKGRK